MASRRLPDLSPIQVVELQDALLANADRLLTSARTVLNLGNIALGRSLAILGLEESGKAIALHERRVAIAYAPEGEPFVDSSLRDLWTDHRAKLELVYRFLVEERYYFAVQPPDPAENETYLGTIERWSSQHNHLKQRGFYVDVGPAGNVMAPADDVVETSLADVIDHVHQIGWQLRLGEHIEAKAQAEAELGEAPASDEDVERMREVLSHRDDEIVEQLLASMRQGREGRRLNNSAYRFPAPGGDPFQNVGRPGYEAQDRELRRLADEIDRADD